jgi:enoyl-CoA hydratase/carnithine racemase
MLLSGELIDAHTALQQGLITRVVEHDELAETTMRFARQVCRTPESPACARGSFCVLYDAHAPLSRKLRHA